MGRSDTEAMSRWTGRKAWEIVWGELREEGTIWKRRQGGQMGNRGKWHGESSVGKERYGSNEGVDGRETVEIAWGEFMVGRSDTEATRGWTEGKPWEIAWGELRWDGAMREGRQGGRKGNRGK